jgi:hypothetical protein
VIRRLSKSRLLLFSYAFCSQCPSAVDIATLFFISFPPFSVATAFFRESRLCFPSFSLRQSQRGVLHFRGLRRRCQCLPSSGMFLKNKCPKRTVDPARNCGGTEEGVTLETPGVQEEHQVDTTASNGWSHLCIGPQFCGEEFNFVNWDSIITV